MDRVSIGRVLERKGIPKRESRISKDAEMRWIMTLLVSYQTNLIHGFNGEPWVKDRNITWKIGAAGPWKLRHVVEIWHQKQQWISCSPI